jgi:hypothetical protein
MAENRPVRNCIGCGKSDTGPRDQVNLPDGSVVYWHFDCHALASTREFPDGCPSCKAILDTAGGLGNHLQDDALVDHLMDVMKTPHAERAEVFTTDDASGGYAKAVEDGIAHPHGTVVGISVTAPEDVK